MIARFEEDIVVAVAVWIAKIKKEIKSMHFKSILGWLQSFILILRQT